MLEDEIGGRYFSETKSIEDFYLQLRMFARNKMGKKRSPLFLLMKFRLILIF